MKRLIILALLLMHLHKLDAQQVTVMPPTQPLYLNNAFQLQYVVTEPALFQNIASPGFDSLQLVSGPTYYKGTATIDGRVQPIQNITYTLVPIIAGKIKVKPVTIYLKNGSSLTSKALTLSVAQPPAASFRSQSSYTDVALFKPSRENDLNKLINENLFILTQVSKQSCFVGEPVIATFKLYSRLQSSSEVLNSPSLYGFNVIDMLNTNEAHQSVEVIKGRIFNTAVLRKVQLYPERAGDLIIDEMTLANEVEFEDSGTQRKSKVSKELVSPRVTVHVKPLPPDQPASFSGAVGQFLITSRLERKTFNTNEQNRFIVTVSGRGNFNQLIFPDLKWPSGIDAYEPFIREELDKNQAPIEGSKIFTTRFSADSAGRFILPAVLFSYFDPIALEYRQIASDSLLMQITASKKRPLISLIKSPSSSSTWIWYAGAGIISILVIALLIRRRKNKVKELPAVIDAPPVDYSKELDSIDTRTLSGKEICIAIQKILYEFQLQHKMLSDLQLNNIREIQAECELTVYSSQQEEMNKQALIEKAKAVVQA